MRLCAHSPFEKGFLLLQLCFEAARQIKCGSGTNGTTGHEAEKWRQRPEIQRVHIVNFRIVFFQILSILLATCPYKDQFHSCFVAERKRQWEVHETLGVQHSTSLGSVLEICPVR